MYSLSLCIILFFRAIKGNESTVATLTELYDIISSLSVKPDVKHLLNIFSFSTAIKDNCDEFNTLKGEKRITIDSVF